MVEATSKGRLGIGNEENERTYTEIKINTHICARTTIGYGAASERKCVLGSIYITITKQTRKHAV